jgi:hypothetical protein
LILHTAGEVPLLSGFAHPASTSAKAVMEESPSDKRVLVLGKQLIKERPANGKGSIVIFSDSLYPLQNLTDAEHLPNFWCIS